MSKKEIRKVNKQIYANQHNGARYTEASPISQTLVNKSCCRYITVLLLLKICLQTHGYQYLFYPTQPTARQQVNMTWYVVRHGRTDRSRCDTELYANTYIHCTLIRY